MPILVLFARVLVSGLLLVAALAKLRDIRGFADTLLVLGYVPRRLARLAPAGGLGVIVAELAVAVAVAVAPTTAMGLGLGAVLFAALAAVALHAARRSAPVECRCFGVAGAPLGWPHVYRNAAVSIVALAGLSAALVDPGVGSGVNLDPGMAVLTVAAALMSVAAGLFLDDLIALFRG